jgi:hypothetical protein
MSQRQVKAVLALGLANWCVEKASEGRASQAAPEICPCPIVETPGQGAWDSEPPMCELRIVASCVSPRLHTACVSTWLI